MIRHLKRLTEGIDEALAEDFLTHKDLARLQPYQPNLAVTWLFQRSMSIGMKQTIGANQINALLSGVFEEMEQLGDRVIKPFLQDVVKFSALLQTLVRVSVKHPLLVVKVIPQVGVMTLAEWFIHYINLGIYAGLYPIARRLKPQAKYLSPSQKYLFFRWLDALQYGSGNDFENDFKG
jgi:lycopene cyclase CruP